MALFGFGKKKDSPAPKEVKKVEKAKATPSTSKKEAKEEVAPKKVKKTDTKVSTERSGNYSSVLIKPRITEKAAILAEERNVYTFDVHPEATKKEIEKAVEKNYKVKPVKVNITDVKRKRVFSRGKLGIKAGGKKAMVYLKDGDKIEFV